MSYSEQEILDNRNSLLNKAKSANGKLLGELDSHGYLLDLNRKGRIGDVIQLFLGKEPDSNPQADFPEANLELKATGLLDSSKTENHYRAKERLVLHMINYEKDHGILFEDSGLLTKCGSMLITCYKYLPATNKGEKADYGTFPVVDSFIYELTDEDKKIIKDDYDIILDKINNGKAETLSESDTMYLAACTKSSDSSKRTKQYNSDILAKPRAFSLKSSFMTSVIERFITGQDNETLVLPDKVITIKKKSFHKPLTIEEKLIELLKPYYGKTVEELHALFPEVNMSSKSRLYSFVSRMAGVKDLANTDEFKKANIHIKTVRLEEDGHIVEHMSFGIINFIDCAKTPWFESDLCAYFQGSKLLIPVFRKTNGTMIFEKAVLYSLPDIVWEEFIKYTYDKLSETLNKGELVKDIKTTISKNGKTTIKHLTNFVGSKENPVSHIRPKGTNFELSQKPIPVKDKITGKMTYASQTLWLDRRYVKSIIDGDDKSYLLSCHYKIDY